MDFQSVEDWKSNELSKADYARMPWHDVAMGVIGPCVYDIAEHFVLRWNFCKRDKYKRDARFPWMELAGRDGDDEDLVGIQRPKHPVGGYIKHPLTPLNTKQLENQGSVHAQIVRSSADWSSGILVEHSIQNAVKEIIRNAQHYVYIENQFFSRSKLYVHRYETTYISEVTATGEDQKPILNTIGEAIVDACARAAKENRKFRVIVVIPAIPGFAGDLREDAAAGTRYAKGVYRDRASRELIRSAGLLWITSISRSIGERPLSLDALKLKALIRLVSKFLRCKLSC